MENLVDTWSTDDGLPDSSVVTMAQTPDGYLWLGTFAGLVRFDGVRFKVFDAGNTPQLVSSKIVTLHVDQRGALWIRSEYGDLARFENGQFTRFSTADGLPGNGKVRVWGEDNDGNFWIPRESGREILRFENGRFVTRVPSSPITERGYQMLIPTRDGKLWGTGGDILTQLWPGEVVDFAFDASRPEALVRSSEVEPSRVLHIEYLQPSRDGGIWVASRDGLRKFRDGRWQEFRPSPVGLPIIANLYEDSAGNVWLGTWDDGARQLTPNGRVYRHKLTDSPAHEPVRSFFEDREGNFWIGTIGAGLFRVKPRIFSNYGIKDGLEGKIVKSVSVGPDGTAWILNMEQVNRLSDAKSSKIEQVSSDVHGGWCNLVGRDGTVWIGTLDNSLFRYRDGIWFRYSLNRMTQAIFEDQRGRIWIGTGGKLIQVEGDNLREIPNPDTIEYFDVTCLAEDSRGRLYAGSNGAGVFRYSEEGKWTRFSKANGLSDDLILSLHVDSRDTVWVGAYDKGLCRLKDGVGFSYSGPALRLPGLVSSITEDNYSFLWLTSTHGIYRVSKKELDDFADGKGESINTIQYTKRDGLATSQCMYGVQPVASKGKDGRIWFATMAGVASVDPANLSLNNVPPPVVIEEVLVDDVEVTKQSGSVTIPPGKHRIEIRFTALSLTASEKLHFKYQLEKFDPGWIDAGTRRSAYFTAVQPGQYRFRVKGSNNDGVWSESDAALAITILPHYWETAWFQAGAVFLFSGLGLFGYHRRITTLKRERAAQEEFSRRLIESQEQERKRISAELHDGLGQSLLLIRNRAVIGKESSLPSMPPEAPAQFEAISEAALQAINEVRAIAYDLRPYELDRLGLTKAIESIVQKAAVAAHFQTDLDLDLVDDLLPPEFEINLYRIVQEAVSNVVKYAQAKTMTLALKGEENAIHLVVCDDGRGFALADGLPDPSVKGGLGLAGILERAKIMGGQAIFESAPGQGTTLTVSIPLRKRERH